MKQPQVEDHEHETESGGKRDMVEKANQKFAKNSQDMQDVSNHVDGDKCREKTRHKE